MRLVPLVVGNLAPFSESPPGPPLWRVRMASLHRPLPPPHRPQLWGREGVDTGLPACLSVLSAWLAGDGLSSILNLEDEAMHREACGMLWERSLGACHLLAGK